MALNSERGYLDRNHNMPMSLVLGFLCTHSHKWVNTVLLMSSQRLTSRYVTFVYHLRHLKPTYVINLNVNDTFNI